MAPPLVLDPCLLSRRLLQIRLKRGLNQTQAARVTGVTQGMISRYESFSPASKSADGKQHGQLPSISNLKRLADGYQCSIDYMVGRTDEMGI